MDVTLKSLLILTQCILTYLVAAESDKKLFSVSVNFEEVLSIVGGKYLSVTLSPNGQEEDKHFNFRYYESLVGGTMGYSIFTRDVVSGQILLALSLTRKTKKRSSKSDYF